MRSAKHLRFIRSLPCLVCGTDQAVDACHVRYSDAAAGKVNPGLGAKPGDEWTIPMCRYHHTAQHKGSETGFWKNLGLDPLPIAQDLFRHTGDALMGESIIRMVQNG